MPDPKIRVRFAPSPTGYLHVGGARTALFNWLYARKTRGTFLLRIEDTDRARSSEEHVQIILRGLNWLGLDWDEEVVFQNDGLPRHQETADRLVHEGKAYEEEGAIRFRMPEDEIVWEDAVYGPITFQGADIKDWIILRSDRTPTYNFSVVLDDIEMGISQVMRGDDHLSNTPKQIAVYRALGLEPPGFAHVPMIHGPDGKRLSKRHGATAVGDYRKRGILATAMRNFLALLGWNPGDDRELFFASRELIEAFSIDAVQRKSAVFDSAKLEWMNGQHMSRTPPEELLPLIQPELEQLGIAPDATERDRLLRSIEVVRERARTTVEAAQRVAVRVDASFIERDTKADKFLAKDVDGFRSALAAAGETLDRIAATEWTPELLETELRNLAQSRGLKAGQVFQPIRVALTGNTVSEPVNVLLTVVGRGESLARIRAAKEWEPTPA